MKKLLLSFFTIIAFAFYAINSKMIGGPAVTADNIVNDQASSSEPVLVPTVKKTQSSPIITQPAQPHGQYKDGSYVGDPADAFYGTVQVKAVVSGGQLADVQFLNYPQDRSRSVSISNRAMPQLTQEAISAQSAQVDTVSGATATSGAFVQSLASALAQAKN